MKNNCLAWAAVMLIAALGCSRPSPPWNGTWKLNKSKSNIPGTSFSVTISPAAEYHFDNGKISYNFRCDGKEYSATPNRTISCSQESASVIDQLMKEKGESVMAYQWELSADEKLITIKQVTMLPEGGAQGVKQNIYSRESGSAGFGGRWRNEKVLESIPQLTLALNERSLHIAFSGTGQYADPTLDGSDVPMRGPGVQQGVTISIRSHGPREFLTLTKLGSEISKQGSLSLSTDGRTLVEQYWPANEPEQKTTLVYDKQ